MCVRHVRGHAHVAVLSGIVATDEYAAVCCGVLQCVAVRCSVLLYVGGEQMMGRAAMHVYAECIEVLMSPFMYARCMHMGPDKLLDMTYPNP